MKSLRLNTFSFLVIILLFLVACGADPTPAPTPTAVDPPATVLAPTPTLIAEPPTLPPPEITAPETVAETAEPAGPISPWPAGDFGYGVQSHAVVGDPQFTMDVIRNQLDVDWVKVQMEWPLVQPDPDTYQWFFYDGVVDEAANFDLRLMLSVVGAPGWTRAAGGEHGPPDDFNLYTAFLTELLERYPGQIHAIEVWNEQNLDREWATAEGLNPASYVRFLSLAYQVIKAHDPNIIVISGALAPTGVHDGVTSYDDFIYMDEMLAAGLLNYADCVGAHHNGYNIGPDVGYLEAGSTPKTNTAFYRGPFDNPHHSWSFKTTLEVYAEKITAVDANAKLCVTEFGWASSEGYDVTPAGFEFAQDNSLEEQAEYIVQAFQLMRASGNVWLAFLFNYDFGNKGGGPTDDPVPYSIIDSQGAPRPAFHALAQMEKPR